MNPDTTEMDAVTERIAPVHSHHAASRRPCRHLFPRLRAAFWGLLLLGLLGGYAAGIWAVFFALRGVSG